MSVDGLGSTIHLHRRWTLDNAARVMSVVIDAVEAAQIRNGERLELRISPGEHRIQLTAPYVMPSETLLFQAGSGEEVRFVCRSRGNFPHRSTIDLQREASPALAHAGVGTKPHGPSQAALRMDVVETDQFEERLGEEVRTIDNRDSATGVTRTIRASREWVHTVTVGAERETTASAEIGGGLAWVTVKGAVEQELHRTYAKESQTREVFEEQITITVPERTVVRLVLRWKRIWQRGIVRVTDGGASVDVPFQVVVSLTFDQVQQDIDHAS